MCSYIQGETNHAHSERTGHVHFVTTGENMTSIIRDMWDSSLVLNAMNACTEGLGMTRKQALNICTGRMKLTGTTEGNPDGTLEGEEDNAKVYLTLEKQIYAVEMKFISMCRLLFTLERELDYWGNMWVAATKEGYEYRDGRTSRKKRTKKTIIDLKDKISNALKSLEILYPLDNRLLSDLPILQMGSCFSSMEIASLEDYQTKFVDRSLYREACKAEIGYNFQHAIGTKTTPPSPRLYKFIDDSIPTHDEEEFTDKLPEPVDITNCNDAWIDRKGICYICGFQEHINLANELERHGIVESVGAGGPSVTLENKGWLKLTSQKFIYLPSKKGRPLKMTKKQVRVIMQYFNERAELEFNFTGYDSSNDLLNSLEEMELI